MNCRQPIKIFSISEQPSPRKVGTTDLGCALGPYSAPFEWKEK